MGCVAAVKADHLLPMDLTDANALNTRGCRRCTSADCPVGGDTHCICAGARRAARSMTPPLAVGTGSCRVPWGDSMHQRGARRGEEGILHSLQAPDQTCGLRLRKEPMADPLLTAAGVDEPTLRFYTLAQLGCYLLCISMFLVSQITRISFGLVVGLLIVGVVQPIRECVIKPRLTDAQLGALDTIELPSVLGLEPQETAGGAAGEHTQLRGGNTTSGLRVV
jgi:hypothetical protein